MATLADIAAAAEQQQERPQSILLYGKPLTGKTTMALALANEGYRVWLLNLDAAGFLVGLNAVKKENWGNVHVIDIPDTPQNPVGIRTIGRFFQNCRKNAVIKICEKHGEAACVLCKSGDAITEIPVGTFTNKDVVIVDNATTLSKSALATASQGTIKNLESNFQKIEWDNYNYQGMLLDNVFANMKRAPFHRIFISHEDVVEAADGTEKIYPIAGTRNYSRNVAKDFDHVVRLKLENKSHKAISGTTADNSSIQGSRTNGVVEKGDTLADLLQGKLRPLAATNVAEVEVEVVEKSVEQEGQAATGPKSILAQMKKK